VNGSLVPLEGSITSMREVYESTKEINVFKKLNIPGLTNQDEGLFIDIFKIKSILMVKT
tara:strand:+ start:1533 stop:1709 length:177 start_codon:yes stop_codon:yes gene_type:complete